MNASVRARLDARGFSFVELLITIVIAGIAFAAIVPLFVQGAKATSADKARNLAKSIAQDRIEKIRQLPYNLITENNLSSTGNLLAVAPPALPNYPAWNWYEYFGPTATTNNEGDSTKTYNVTYSVVFVGGTNAGTARTYSSTGDGTEDYLKVAVSVTWTGNPRPARTVILQTLVFRQNDGPQVTGLDVLSGPLSDPPSGTGLGSGIDTNGWLTQSTEAGPIIFRAVIGTADAGLVKLVKFRVDGPGGPFLLEDAVLPDTSVNPTVAFKTTWVWTPPVVDGTYTVSATAYSSATGYKVYAGNTWSRMLRIEQGDPEACTGVWRLAGNQEIMLSWTPSVSQDVTAYDIYRETGSSGGSAVKIGSFSGQVGPQMPPVFIDWGSTSAGPPDGNMGTLASPPTSYYYWIVARDWLGNPVDPAIGGASKSVAGPILGATASLADTTPPAIPAPPSPPSLTSLVTNQLITLNWVKDALNNPPSLLPTVGGDSLTPNPQGALGGYLVFRDGDLKEPYAMKLLKATTWSNVGVGWDESHTYTLRAFDGSLNVSSEYGPTEAATGTTALAPTYNFTLKTGAACTVTVTNWSSQAVLTGASKFMPAGSSSVWVAIPGDYELKATSGSATKVQIFSIIASDLPNVPTGF